MTYTKDREIFGVPTICTYNGINVESMAKVGGAFSEGEVNLIGVAFMQRHHGYERIIEGRANIIRRTAQKNIRCICIWWETARRNRFIRS